MPECSLISKSYSLFPYFLYTIKLNPYLGLAEGIFDWSGLNYSENTFVFIPEPMQYDIYTLAFPFDLRCESGNTFTPKIYTF